MALVLTTTGTTVDVTELGIKITHPTTNFDISEKFSQGDIKRAATLTTAIRNGVLTWKKTLAGAVEPAAEYDPEFHEVDEESGGLGNYLDRSLTLRKYYPILNYQWAESLAEGTTTATGYQTRLSISPSLLVGSYRVGFSFEYSCSGLLSNADFQVLVDGVVKHTLNTTDTNYRCASGFAKLDVTVAGAKTVSIQFRRGLGTALIRNARIELWRVG